MKVRGKIRLSRVARALFGCGVALAAAAGSLAPAGSGDCDVLVVPALSETEFLTNNSFLSYLATLTGSAADYYDARGGTPTLAQLQQYDLVVTFVDANYSDRYAMGDVLADYVEGGGKVILGNYTHHTEGAGEWLDGRIMAQYNPARVDDSLWSGDYTGDGTDCVFDGVPPFHTLPYDHIDSLVGSAGMDGTYDDGSPVTAYRLDRSVYYVAGHMGGWISDSAAQWAWARLTANVCACAAEPLYGACCNASTGGCTDDVLAGDCQPPLQWNHDATCASLDPPCGNPGACCNEANGSCSQQLEQNCAGRFEAGSQCADDPFVPACGDTGTCDILYAPSASDAPKLRSELSFLTASAADYFDARQATPTLAELMQYDAVITWCDNFYAASIAMGDVLADYVEAGGRVILGQWSAPGGNNLAYLEGRLMEEYNPVEISGLDWGGTTYAQDGEDCIHDGISFYSPRIYDQIGSVAPDAWSDGTYLNEEGEQYPSVAYRHDRKVFYISGFSSAYNGPGGPGQWGQLIANICACPEVDLFGACCDATTGTCTDDVQPEDCLPPLQWTKDAQCSELSPLCGNPGACCDDTAGLCSEELEVDCQGRFRPGETCVSEPFDPPCGEFEGCTHSIVMRDDTGNGWSDGHLDVYVGGFLVLEGLTLLDGFGPEEVFFQAAAGEEITTVWHPGPFGQFENSYCIEGLDGTALGCDGEGGEFPTGITVFGDCTELVCGNGVCQVGGGEDCTNCFLDCGDCACASQAYLPAGSAYYSDLDCLACGGVQIVADNFRLLEETQILGVKAWGSYSPGGIPSASDQFTLVIREDIGSLPGSVIAQYGPMTGSRTAIGVNQYEHVFEIDETLPAGTYWLELYNDTVDTEDAWAWSKGDLDPVYGLPGLVFSLTFPEEWSFNVSLDLAFELDCVTGTTTLTMDKTDQDVTLHWDALPGFSYDVLYAPSDPMRSMLRPGHWTRVENVAPPWYHAGAANDGVDYLYEVDAVPAAFP